MLEWRFEKMSVCLKWKNESGWNPFGTANRPAKPVNARRVLSRAGGLTVERSSDRKSPRTETRSRSTSDGDDRRDGSGRHRRRRRRHHDARSSPRSVTVAALTVTRRYAVRIRAWREHVCNAHHLGVVARARAVQKRGHFETSPAPAAWRVSGSTVERTKPRLGGGP